MATMKRRPRTGDKRRKNQPLKIDRLPSDIRDAIQFLKNFAGKTWQEIEELSSLPYDPNWKTKGGGFVPWDALPTPILELFPDLRLPHANLHRWYDLRVSQVVSETLARSVQARELAEAFAKSAVEGGNEAVLNAARDQLMFLLAENADPSARLLAAKGLISLSQRMQAARLNDLRERKVDVDERRIAVLEKREALLRSKLESEAQKAAKKLDRGKLTGKDLQELVQRTFGIAPEAAHE